jgi:hypothetical protein
VSASDMNRAIAQYRTDQRFRAITDSVVYRALSDHGPINPERATRAVHDIATTIAALLLQQIYEGDAELGAMRAERDRYRELAEAALLTVPPRLTIKDEGGKEG